jgi:hypothetical protein
MSSVKIDRHSEINELLAKIYLDTKLKLSKKELLEIIFDINYEDYGLLVQRIKSRLQRDNLDVRKSFIKKLSGKLIAEDNDEVDPKSIWVDSVEE